YTTLFRSRKDGGKVAGWLASREKFRDLEAIALDDRLDVSLVEDGVEKPIEKLSNGQRAIALLPLILRTGDCPIVFDQPEDDVDATYMIEVARRLRELKVSRQVIIVTHDANLVVLGEADRVVVMCMEGAKRAAVAKTGTIDECRSDIVRLLEGGEEAFRTRGERYGLVATKGRDFANAHDTAR